MPSGDEVALMHALYEVGPISVAMDAGLKTFQVHECILYYIYIQSCIIKCSFTRKEYILIICAPIHISIMV